jgi:phosphoribosyl 1,2-cyclic phosphodiesterase/ActR/RegA family two-component response regulator
VLKDTAENADEVPMHVKTVLLMDDDKGLRSILAEFLKEHGWQVWEAADGETGVLMAKQHRPAAVICDLLMPRINGFQVCSALRQDPALVHTRIVAVSGKDFSSNRTSALEAGADEFLGKPFRPQALVELLERLTGTPKSHPGTAPAPAQERGTTVKFWGVRGSIPAPGPGTVHYGGNTSCIEVRADDEVIILDSGSGIRPLGLELAAEFKGRPLQATILITHTHWDHIQGLPFFLPAYDPRNHVRIMGYQGERESLAQILAMQMESPYFPVSFKEVPGQIVVQELKDLEFSVGKVKVQAAFANHPGVCMGYRLLTSSGSIAYLPDNEPLYHHHAQRNKLPFNPAAGSEYTESEDQQVLDFLRDTDVLIIDSQYDPEEYRTHMGWGHGCVDDVVALAIRAQVKRLYLFHHDPEHNDAKVTQMLEHARRLAASRRCSLSIEAAREGEVCALPLPS